MAFKTITIKEEVYKDLTKAKKVRESFSEFFVRVLRERRPPLKEFYGAWELENGEGKKVARALKRFRREFEQSFRQHHESTR